MKKYILISCFVASIFGLLSCEDEDPLTPSVNFITACNEAEFNIQFYNTNFWDNDVGVWYDLNNGGSKLTNPITGTSQFCRKYIDESTIDPNDPFGSIDTEPTNNSEVDVEINSDGTMDITLEFTDANDLGVSDDFRVDIEIDDIASYSTGQMYTIDGFLGVSVGGDLWNATYMVNFTTIDVANHIYEGSASADIENYWPLSSFPDHYEPGTSLNFTCDITFSFDKL